MQPQIQQLIEEIKAKKVFRRNRKRLKLKILPALPYFYELSLRKTSKLISLFQKISHEYKNLSPQDQKNFKTLRKKKRRLIAIDETKLKLEDKQIFIWNAVDVDSKECLFI